ncbi:DUF1127 domain-containing protein [Primorskyibacter sp. S187A]|uniref:DUF1127 domain-containing protein n=1 Tax=Primorskyibacter sp. S187A TaxID=3415130 RepID=UPI003C7C3759
MTQLQPASALTYLQNRPLTPAASVALFVAVALVSWAERRRTRIALKHLDDHLLDDIGVTRAQASKEVERPFWQG